jgi:putative ABC transport system permease protein
MMIFAGIKSQVEAIPGVRAASYMSFNTPYSSSMNGTGFKYEGKEYGCMDYQVDDDLLKTLQGELVKGRWFSKEDAASNRRAVVLNESLEKEVFPNGDALGKELDGEERRRVVVGVIKDMKHEGDYKTPTSGIYQRVDTSFYNWVGAMLVRVDPSVDAAFEAHLHNRLTSLLKGASVEIQHLDNQLAGKNTEMMIPLIAAGVIAAFLIINVALGLFGVLWYNISRRRQEIGLRRAIGATAGDVSRQILGETLVLTTIAVLLALFFAVQFPLLNVFNMPDFVYAKGIVLAILFIYVLVFLCAIYPGREAAAIYPAVALHED